MKSAETTTTSDPTRLTQAFVDQLGNRYEVISKLGAGAFGEVYRAKDTMLDRDVAIKRIRIDVFDGEQRDEVRKRSIREAQLAAALNHPKIVTIHDVVDCPDAIFIVMEYVSGETLRETINKTGRLSLVETIEILSQTAEALDFAHGQKIIHRDVKPGNIMVRADGGVKVMDFGIAKSEASGNLTAVGAILGTPNYMSPEQAEGLSTVGSRSDLFSLGSIAFECLSGQKAFRAESVVGTLLRVVKGDTPQIDCNAVHLHPDAGKVLTRALAKDPAARFDSGAELIEMLRQVPMLEAESVTVELPAPPVITRRERGSTSSFDLGLQGNLQEKPLGQAIREIYTTRKTGILHVDSESVSRRLYFRKGSIVFANSSREEDRLGEFLISRGDIDRSAFERASRVMRETGQRFGRTLVELGFMTDEQMQASVLVQIEHIIRALFSLTSGTYGFEKMDRPVERDIVLDISTGDTILRSIRETVSVDIVRKELGDLSGVLLHSENPLLLYQKISLDPSEGFILSRVDGVCSIAELASVSPLGEEETLKCVYGLMSAGVLELGESATSRPQRQAERKVRLPEPEVVVRTSQSVTSQPAQPKAKEETGAAAAEKATLEGIATKHASLASTNHYELLEVDPEATASGIKAAYYTMVKRYHPDRHHSTNLKDMEGLLEELFVKISAAYEVLSDASERAAYDSMALRPKAKPKQTSSPPVAAAEQPRPEINPKVLAHEHYDAARRSFDGMAYHDAIQFLREAVRLDPIEPAYHKLLATALTKNPLWIKEAEQSFMDALELNPDDVDCYLSLAEIYKESGMTTRAQRMYRKVLERDPANEIAFEHLPDENPKSRSRVDRLKSALARR